MFGTTHKLRRCGAEFAKMYSLIIDRLNGADQGPRLLVRSFNQIGVSGRASSWESAAY